MRAVYDHKLKELVFASANLYGLLKEAGVPASTSSAWSKNKPRKVITLENFDVSKHELIENVHRLKPECNQLSALLDLYGFVNKRLRCLRYFHQLETPTEQP